MKRIFVHGLGAVSPAGWGVPALDAALAKREPLPAQPLARPGWQKTLQVRSVPASPSRPAFLSHPRLRRASAIAQHIVGAALEALGKDAAQVPNRTIRFGIVVCLMAGGVAYSRRFCEEIFRDPATASPLIFPETVFNASASHLAAYLGSGGINYTLVGDDGTFPQGLALAAEWLIGGQVDGCVVVGGEELDWIVADAVGLFHRQTIHSGGAGALYLRASDDGAIAELAAVTDSFPFTQNQDRRAAAQQMKLQLCAAGAGHAPGTANELLCLGTQDRARDDIAEIEAWQDWDGPRLAPKETLGEAFAASAAWQCVAACDALRRGEFTAANVSIVGVNQQAIGARFVKLNGAKES